MYQEGQTATNPKTGQKIVFQGGLWVAAGGPATGIASPKYQEKRAVLQADDDITRLKEASEISRSGYGTEQTALRAEALLPNTPTGAFADEREGLGRVVGGTLGWLPGIPNAEETSNLETMRNIQSQGALGDVAKLKGPLSEKELAFIQKLQISPGATKETNRRVIEAQKWVAKRQTAYASALKTWDRKLGSPSAVNAQGLTFDDWWGRYSASALPQPGLGPAPRPAASAPRATGKGYKIISVE